MYFCLSLYANNQRTNKMQKVILNTCYGGFAFSDEFMAELFRRYPGDRSFWGEPEKEDPCMSLPNYAAYVRPFCPGYSQFKGTPCFREEATGLWFRLDNQGYTGARVLLRSDPRVVALFEEWKAAGKNTSYIYSKLELDTVPEHWDWHVTDYDGVEDIVMTFPWKPVMNDLLKNERTHPLTQRLVDSGKTVEEFIKLQ